MENKYICAIIGAAVAIIVIGSLLAPIVSDTVATSDKYTNEGYFNLGYSETGIPEIIWEHDDPFSITVDGQREDLSSVPRGLVTTVISSSSTLIRCLVTSSGVTFYSYDSTAPGSFIVSSNDSNGYIKFFMNDGLMTANYSTTGEINTKVYGASTAGYYYFSSGGDYVMKKTDSPCYLSDDSIISLSGHTYAAVTSGYLDVGIFARGTYDNLTFSLMFGATDSNITDLVAHYTDVPGHDGVLLNKYTFLLTSVNGDVTDEVDITYTYFIVPAEVDIPRLAPMDSSAAGIIQIVPLIVIVALIVAAIAFFMRSRF